MMSQTTNLDTYSSLDLSLSRSSVRMLEDPISCNLEIALCRTFSSSFEVGGSFSIPKRMRYLDSRYTSRYVHLIERPRKVQNTIHAWHSL